jgi:hypothetical protein
MSAGEPTEYIYFGGQRIAEHNPAKGDKSSPFHNFVSQSGKNPLFPSGCKVSAGKQLVFGDGQTFHALIARLFIPSSRREQRMKLLSGSLQEPPFRRSTELSCLRKGRYG